WGDASPSSPVTLSTESSPARSGAFLSGTSPVLSEGSQAKFRRTATPQQGKEGQSQQRSQGQKQREQTTGQAPQRQEGQQGQTGQAPQRGQSSQPGQAQPSQAQPSQAQPGQAPQQGQAQQGQAQQGQAGGSVSLTTEPRTEIREKALVGGNGPRVNNLHFTLHVCTP